MTGQTEDPRERPDRSGDSELPSVEAVGPYGLPAIWLRDNCGCAQCRDPGTGARLTSIGDLSGGRLHHGRAPDRQPDRDRVRPGPAHRHLRRRLAGPVRRPRARRGASRYAALAVADDGRSEDAKHLWDAAGIAGAFPLGSWPLYRAESAHRQACLRAVLRDGFVVLTDMPREAGAVLAIAESIGAVRETERGRVVDVRARPAEPAQAGRPARRRRVPRPRFVIRC